MADYKENSTEGQINQFTRCSFIEIHNPRPDQQRPVYFNFAEEEVTIFPNGDIFSKPSEEIYATYDPNEIINIRNPLNWELTGQTTTLEAIYVQIASVYWHFALKRDQASS